MRTLWKRERATHARSQKMTRISAIVVAATLATLLPAAAASAQTVDPTAPAQEHVDNSICQVATDGTPAIGEIGQILVGLIGGGLGDKAPIDLGKGKQIDLPQLGGKDAGLGGLLGGLLGGIAVGGNGAPGEPGQDAVGKIGGIDLGGKNADLGGLLGGLLGGGLGGIDLGKGKQVGVPQVDLGGKNADLGGLLGGLLGGGLGGIDLGKGKQVGVPQVDLGGKNADLGGLLGGLLGGGLGGINLGGNGQAGQPGQPGQVVVGQPAQVVGGQKNGGLGLIGGINLGGKGQKVQLPGKVVGGKVVKDPFAGFGGFGGFGIAGVDGDDAQLVEGVDGADGADGAVAFRITDEMMIDGQFLPVIDFGFLGGGAIQIPCGVDGGAAAAPIALPGLGLDLGLGNFCIGDLILAAGADKLDEDFADKPGLRAWVDGFLGGLGGCNGADAPAGLDLGGLDLGNKDFGDIDFGGLGLGLGGLCIGDFVLAAGADKLDEDFANDPALRAWIDAFLLGVLGGCDANGAPVDTGAPGGNGFGGINLGAGLGGLCIGDLAVDVGADKLDNKFADDPALRAWVDAFVLGLLGDCNGAAAPAFGGLPFLVDDFGGFGDLKLGGGLGGLCIGDLVLAAGADKLDQDFGNDPALRAWVDALLLGVLGNCNGADVGINLPPVPVVNLPAQDPIACGVPAFGLGGLQDKFDDIEARKGLQLGGLFDQLIAPVLNDKIGRIDAKNGNGFAAGIFNGVLGGGCVQINEPTAQMVQQVTADIDIADVVCGIDFDAQLAGLLDGDVEAGAAFGLQADHCDADLLIENGHGGMLGDVGVSVSCLAGNGRVDSNIVNHGDDEGVYVLEFGNLRNRQRIVDAGDWARISISGRRDGQHPVRVFRNGVNVLDTLVTVACDEEVAVSSTEVSVINACRAGYGYLLFQFVNDLDDAVPYVIEFDNVRNRSVLAQPNGAGVRAVTGRPSGTHGYLVRNGNEVIQEGTVDISC